jgi:hypothetical protein
MAATVDILLQQILFLATSSDSEIHPDVAVAQPEDLVHAVGLLPKAEREAFKRTVAARIAGSAGAELDALRSLQEMLDS